RRCAAGGKQRRQGAVGGATTQIASMIDAVQRDTREVVGSMSAAAPQVESSVGKAQSAARALEEIRAGAALALDNIRDVASATQEQSVANQRVAEHIERIANMVAQSADTASQARHSAQQLEALADELNAAVAKFQV
ncbi:methyl-accepting chemotaxis protein, partial [Rivihabitans pingtungensis]|uniref:methyl-accepting chemotaxis protein n=1 Tax=Rivihabitans pingtungensis TaxID=1054498 RepID=UPI002CA41ECC